MTFLTRVHSACVVALIAGAAVFATVASAQQFGTADEAKAMLAKTVAALKADKANTLEQINEEKSGFLNRDLYPFLLQPQRRQERSGRKPQCEASTGEGC